MTPTPLGLDPEQLVTCVECGLCLPHCPTYRVTGLELASPRGRITAMRAVEAGAAITDAFVTAMEECVQCRGCEAACPSSVPYGALMEQTRAALTAAPATPARRWRRAAERIGLGALGHPRLLRAASWTLWAGQRLRLVPRRLGLPPLTRATLRTRVAYAPPERADVWLFTGCVMDAWQRPVHEASARVLRAMGQQPARPVTPGCCGALAVHAGHHDAAVRAARATVASMPGNAPVVVNSAGCGAAMKEYGRLLGTAEGAVFAARVVDFSEHVRASGPPPLRSVGSTVVVQDPCHLRHVQRRDADVPAVLAPAYDVRTTADDGLCCGAGGAYAVLQPELAAAMRDRKIAALRAAGGGAAVVASANPGCTFHLSAGGCTVRHPAQLLADALTEETPR